MTPVSTPATSTTIAYARLKRFRGVYLWEVPHCPYCGRTHTHGGGEITGDPRSYLSYRSPHCATNTQRQPDYLLVEMEGRS